MTKTFTIKGLSVLELRDKYGIGNGGFYDQSWYTDQPFAKQDPMPGIYEIDFGEGTRNKAFGEQTKGLEKGFEVAHPAVILEAVLRHYAQTKEYLLKDYWVRTSLLDSEGGRVHVGYCDAKGVNVYSWDDDVRYDNVGVGASRKLKNLDPRKLAPVESSPLELRVAKLEERQEKIEKRWKEIFKGNYTDMTMKPARGEILARIRETCVGANPEIVKLKLGCEIFREGATKREFFVGQFADQFSIVRVDDAGAWLPMILPKPPKSQQYEVIGRPIRLADVLLAVAWVREVPVPLHDQRVLSVCSYWDMRNDSLDDQDGRTVGLIFNLLGEVAARAEKTDQA